MVQIDDIRKLIRKHKYEVALKIIEDGKITALFPNRHEKPFCEPFNNIYTIKTNGVAFQTDETLKDFIEAPQYALRSIVFADILRMCDIIGYNSKLLGLYINDKEKTHEDFYKHMLSFKLSSHQIQQETDLEELVDEARIFSFSQELKEKAKEQQVSRGFQIVHNILTGAAS
ncbi:uncharacterized protein METZ01_LOCUS199390 [marine metagenome]|uniref:Uncharacterized protein n=1 Tax=marine metagenome TaxID=408172 RepID=A0A382E6X3_9ZZZZ